MGSRGEDPVKSVLADARRTQILDAATRVFAKQGFHGATIRQVAKEAGLADGTIYLYFANKDDLLLGILDRLNETEQRPLDFAAGLESDFRTFFIAYVRHRIELMDANFDAFHAVLPDLLANPHLRERYLREIVEPSFTLAEPFFRELIARGALKPIDPKIALRAVTSMVLGMMVLRMLGDETVQQEWGRLPEMIAGIYLDGIGTEDEHERHSSTTKAKHKTRRAH